MFVFILHVLSNKPSNSQKNEIFMTVPIVLVKCLCIIRTTLRRGAESKSFNANFWRGMEQSGSSSGS